MKLVVGIGNPGSAYVNTRHNAGLLFVDEFRKQISNLQFPSPNQIKIFQSDKFMNESGEFVRKLITNYKLLATDLYIVHDDLDIPLGEFKIQFGRGPKEHNGLKSIDDKLGSSAYWHVRIGVDNRDPDNRTPGERYVLENFQDSERKILDEVIKKACHKLINNLRLSINNGE